MTDDGGFFDSICRCSSATAELEAEEIYPSTRQTGKDVEELLAKYPSEAFSFENIAFEGGGMKGLAHAGGLRVLEEAGISGRIKRIAGTSSGAMTAALVAVGYDSYDLERVFKADINTILNDHRFGYLSMIPNVIKTYGWNPGNKFTEWFGEQLKARTGNPDITFQEVYEKYGCQLCIITANVSQMSSEYCHPKTTPDMSVLLAVRMSMSIPGSFAPVVSENGDLLVDGGILCNYPIHCYDGWWLSMKPEDQFLKKLQPLSERYNLVQDDGERFGTYNDKTIGFLLYASDERDFFRRRLDERILKYSSNATIPDTKLSREYEDVDKERELLTAKDAQLDAAADKFLQALEAEELHTKEHITKDDLENVLSKGHVSDENLKILFGAEMSADAIFAKLKNNNGEWFGYIHIAVYLKQQGFDIVTGYMARHKSTKIDNIQGFISAVYNTVSTVAQKHVKQKDVERTVGINTRYIGTMDYTLEDADKKFVIEQGRRSAIAFLWYYGERNLNRPTLPVE